MTEKTKYLIAGLLILVAGFIIWKHMRRPQAVIVGSADSEVPDSITADNSTGTDVPLQESTPLYQSYNAPSPQVSQPPSEAQGYFTNSQLSSALNPDVLEQAANTASVGLPDPAFYFRQE